MSVGLMAEPKKKAAPAKDSPKTSRVRSEAVMIRGRPEWKEWVDELVEFVRADSYNQLVDQALVEYARSHGFGKAAPKR